MKLPSIQKLIALKGRSQRGDKDAERELYNLYSRLVTTSNYRLHSLKKAGYTEYAYELATSYTKSVYGVEAFIPFPESAQEAYENLIVMRKFLSKETSTVSGQKRVESARVKAFRQKFKLTTAPFAKGYIKNATIVKFLKLLGRAPIRAIISERHKSLSNELVELIRGRALTDSSDAEFDRITEMFEKYLETIESGSLVPEEKRFYYDDLVNALKEGVIKTR